MAMPTWMKTEVQNMDLSQRIKGIHGSHDNSHEVKADQSVVVPNNKVSSDQLYSDEYHRYDLHQHSKATAERILEILDGAKLTPMEKRMVKTDEILTRKRLKEAAKKTIKEEVKPAEIEPKTQDQIERRERRKSLIAAYSGLISTMESNRQR